MNTPRVSVIMPLYNAARHVGEAVGSVLAQTMRDFELLVIDDGSTDGSGEIVRAINDPRVRFFQNERNLGTAMARNRGLREARAELIAFLDADDVALPSRLAEQREFLARHPGVSVIGSEAEVIDEDGRAVGKMALLRVAGEEIPATLLFENCIAQSTVMLRKSGLRGFEYRTEFEPAEDYDLWARLAQHARYVNLPRTLIFYRQHGGGVTARAPERMTNAVHAIRAQQCAQLGLELREEIHAHAAQWPPTGTPEILAAVGQWLAEIEDANSRAKIYNAAILHRVLSQRWLRVSLDAWPLGRVAWRAWRGSRFCTASPRANLLLLRRVLPQVLRGR